MWLIAAICVVIPAVLLAVAMRGGDRGGGSTSAAACGGRAQQATVSTPRGLTARHVLREGDPAPTFRLRTLDCGTLDTARYRGRAYVVAFWASWCVPCRKEMPLLERAHRARDGIPVAGVTYADPESESRAFARKYRITFPLASDDGYKVANTFGVVNVPATFFVGADGRVVERVAGSGSTADLDAALERLAQNG